MRSKSNDADTDHTTNKPLVAPPQPTYSYVDYTQHLNHSYHSFQTASLQHPPSEAEPNDTTNQTTQTMTTKPPWRKP